MSSTVGTPMAMMVDMLLVMTFASVLCWQFIYVRQHALWGFIFGVDARWVAAVDMG